MLAFVAGWAEIMIDEMSLKSRWVDLQCRGFTIDRISEVTKSDRKWVRHFLQRNNLKALERMAKQRAGERAKQVMRLEHMIDEAYQAWERSTQVEEITETIEEPVTSQAQISQPAGSRSSYTQVSAPMTVIRTKKTTKCKSGDIAYLKAIQEFMRDVRSILKIDDGTKRVDFSLSLPGEDTIKATLNVKDVAAAELQQWNEAQKERLKQLLDMPPPDISSMPDRVLSTNGDSNSDSEILK